MPNYRITVITKDVSPLLEVKESIQTNQGVIVREINHGERQFSYPIQKFDRGVYTSYIIEAEPSRANQVEKSARQVIGVLRTLLVQWPVAKISPRPVPKIKPTTPEPTDLEPTETVPSKPIKPKKTSPTKKSVKPKKTAESILTTDEKRLKELDDKLAELLKS